MATRDDVVRRRAIINNPSIHPDLRWLFQYYELYLRRAAAPGLPTTTTTSTTSSTSSTSTSTAP